jgi:hypothetical protein
VYRLRGARRARWRGSGARCVGGVSTPRFSCAAARGGGCDRTALFPAPPPLDSGLNLQLAPCLPLLTRAAGGPPALCAVPTRPRRSAPTRARRGVERARFRRCSGAARRAHRAFALSRGARLCVARCATHRDAPRPPTPRVRVAAAAAAWGPCMRLLRALPHAARAAALRLTRAQLRTSVLCARTQASPRRTICPR